MKSVKWTKPGPDNLETHSCRENKDVQATHIWTVIAEKLPQIKCVEAEKRETCRLPEEWNSSYTKGYLDCVLKNGLGERLERLLIC